MVRMLVIGCTLLPIVSGNSQPIFDWIDGVWIMTMQLTSSRASETRLCVVNEGFQNIAVQYKGRWPPALAALLGRVGQGHSAVLQPHQVVPMSPCCTGWLER